MNIRIIMMSVYLIIALGANICVSRRNKSTEDYFTAQRTIGLPLIIALLFSGVISGTAAAGAASAAYTAGIASIWPNLGQGIGTVICVPLLGKFYRAMGETRGVMSVPGAFAYIFDTRCRVVMLAISVISGGVIFAAAVTAAANAAAPILNVPYTAALWAVGVIFIFITCAGGIRGIAVMNILNITVLFAVFGGVAFLMRGKAGGLGNVYNALDKSYFDLFRPGRMTAPAAGLGAAIACLTSPAHANALFSARTYKTAKNGMYITCVLLCIFSVLPAFIGIAAKAAMPDEAASSILYTAGGSLGAGWGGAVTAAVMAAGISTGPAVLLFVCVTAVKDFFCLIKPQATDKQQMRFSRITAAAAGTAFIFLGQNAPSLPALLQGASGIRAAAGIILLAAVYWARVSARAAFGSMLIGGAAAVYWFFAGSPFGIAPMLSGAAVTLVTLTAATLTSREKVSPGFLRFNEALIDYKQLTESRAAPRHSANEK